MQPEPPITAVQQIEIKLNVESHSSFLQGLGMGVNPALQATSSFITPESSFTTPTPHRPYEKYSQL